jgi:hypothetical protein
MTEEKLNKKYNHENLCRNISISDHRIAGIGDPYK